MRLPIVLALGAALAAGICGCGQKGPLVRPTHSPTTPVVIHAPDAAVEPAPDTDAAKR